MRRRDAERPQPERAEDNPQENEPQEAGERDSDEEGGKQTLKEQKKLMREQQRREREEKENERQVFCLWKKCIPDGTRESRRQKLAQELSAMWCLQQSSSRRQLGGQRRQGVLHAMLREELHGRRHQAVDLGHGKLPLQESARRRPGHHSRGGATSAGAAPQGFVAATSSPYNRPWPHLSQTHAWDGSAE